MSVCARLSSAHGMLALAPSSRSQVALRVALVNVGLTSGLPSVGVCRGRPSLAEAMVTCSLGYSARVLAPDPLLAQSAQGVPHRQWRGADRFCWSAEIRRYPGSLVSVVGVSPAWTPERLGCNKHPA